MARQHGIRAAWLSRACLWLMAALTTACGSDAEQEPPDKPARLVRVDTTAAGDGCPSGGWRVHQGEDFNLDGVLQDTEVGSTQLACWPSTEQTSVLSGITAQAPGAACPEGGLRWRSGPDANLDGVLQDSEVMNDQLACFALADLQMPLTDITAEAPGPACSAGGLRIRGGADLNSDGVLQESEVQATRWACFPAAGAPATLERVTPEEPGPTCQAGGVRIRTGTDLNRDGDLQETEVTSTRSACFSAPTPDMTWQQVSGTLLQSVPNAGYLIDGEDRVSIVLPPNEVLLPGDRIAVTGSGYGGWTLLQGTGQQVLLDSVANIACGVLWQPIEADGYWQAAASSANGRRLALAAYPGRIHVSHDGGETWSATGPSGRWFGLASSEDGRVLLASEFGGYLHTSADGGRTWVQRGTQADWTGVASSADGRTLLAANGSGSLSLSTDGGETWAPRAGTQGWWVVAMSADATVMAAAESGGRLAVSRDGGATWTFTGLAADWVALSVSSNGRRMAAVAPGAPLHASVDGGASWSPVGATARWVSLAASGDGMHLIAGTEDGAVQVSADGGASWTPRLQDAGAYWWALASSADGTRLLAGRANGGAWRSAAATTLGTTGAVSGGFGQSLELQYVGAGRFVVLRHLGTPSYR